VDGIESHSCHPEIEDDWILVHQAIDPKRPNLTSFFPKKGIGKRPWTVYRVLTAANLLRVALLTPRACGAASLMARCATPDIGHFICAFAKQNFSRVSTDQGMQTDFNEHL
jgi:hypothetical protein